MLLAVIVFGSVCESICPRKLLVLVGNQFESVGIYYMVNARSDWKLVSFDLDL